MDGGSCAHAEKSRLIALAAFRFWPMGRSKRCDNRRTCCVEVGVRDAWTSGREWQVKPASGRVGAMGCVDMRVGAKWGLDSGSPGKGLWL